MSDDIPESAMTAAKTVSYELILDFCLVSIEHAIRAKAAT